jgi:hypothetical protein
MNRPSGSLERPAETPMDGPSTSKCKVLESINEPLQVMSNDLDDKTHERMDRKVLVTVRDYAFSPFSLLAAIVSESEGQLDPKYEKTPNAAALLREHPKLEEVLRKAWEAKSFREIRNLSSTSILISCSKSS